MFNIKNILVPTDFSKGFFNALNYAVVIAKSTDSELHILHVIEPVVFSSNIMINNNSFDELPLQMEKLSMIDLEKISNLLLEKNVKFSTKVIHGKPSDVILEYAKKNHIDMICIATHGNGTFENFLFGSTTEKVLRKANCPVLSVRIKE
jgi:nucleotide-binding universal stress UspA family protein